MNPGQEDPNNHVPKVSPDDQWDDLDSEPDSKGSQLPPRRIERSLPPKKKLRQANVTRHGEHLKVDAASGASLGKKAAEGARKTAKKATQKRVAKSGVTELERQLNSYRKVSVGGAKNIKEKDADDLSDESEKSNESNLKADALNGPLPAAPEGKVSRLRVREITPPKESGANIPEVSKMIPNVSIQNQKSSADDVARQRRRFVRGERNDWGDKKGRDSTRWMLYSGVGIVLLVVFAVFLAQRASRRTERESDRSFFSQLEASNTEDEVERDEAVIDFLTDSKDEANQIYAAFVTAKSISDFAESLYLGEKNIPIVENRWEPSDTSNDWHPGDQSSWRIVDLDGQRYGILEGLKEDFTDFSAFFRNGDSGLKLDWKATVGYCSASFEDLKAGKGDGSEIRAWISLTDFYTYALPEEKYQSYRLRSPNGEYTLWGYTEIEGELGQTLRNLFVPSQITGEVQSEVQVVISIESGPSESLPNQWIIKGLTRLSWLDE